MRSNIHCRATIAAFYIMIFLVFTGCQNSYSAHKLNFSEMQLNDGSYAFPNLTWGINKTDVESSLGTALGEPILDTEITDQAGKKHINQQFPTDTLYSMFNNVGSATFQFVDDQLISITITFLENQEYSKNNDLDALAQTASEEAKTLFGEPAASEQSSANAHFPVNRTTTKWEHIATSGALTQFVLARAVSENHAGSFVVMVASPTEMEYLSTPNKEASKRKK